MLSADTILTTVVAVSTAVGGFSVGRKTSSNSAIQIAGETVDMLQAQIETLKGDRDARDAELSELRTRVTMLENLVTQRAEVAEVHQEVKSARVVLDKIANKVGAS